MWRTVFKCAGMKKRRMNFALSYNTAPALGTHQSPVHSGNQEFLKSQQNRVQIWLFLRWDGNYSQVITSCQMTGWLLLNTHRLTLVIIPTLLNSLLLVRFIVLAVLSKRTNWKAMKLSIYTLAPLITALWKFSKLVLKLAGSTNDKLTGSSLKILTENHVVPTSFLNRFRTVKYIRISTMNEVSGDKLRNAFKTVNHVSVHGLIGTMYMIDPVTFH